MPTDRSEYMSQYRKDHKEEINSRRRSDTYRQSGREWYQEHAEERRRYSKQYRQANRARFMLLAARQRTKVKGLPECDLTIEYIDSIMPTHCPILGIKLEFAEGKPKHNSPSLDRIDPLLGYVKGNVQVISYKANSMKRDASWDELRAFAEWILNYEYG